MNQKLIWAEMARRKVQFHNNDDWDKIQLWGLFFASEVKPLVDKGLLISYGQYVKCVPGWYYPSKEGWERHIQPLISCCTLEELTKMAGWQ